MSRSVPPGIKSGLEGSCEREVSEDLTVGRLNPGWPLVFSTPAMIGMMELACSNAVRHALPPGSVTVGVRIEVDHLKAVSVGAIVKANSRLIEIEGRRLIFQVEARSGNETVGRGRIVHAIVEYSRFSAGAARKLASR